MIPISVSYTERIWLEEGEAVCLSGVDFVRSAFKFMTLLYSFVLIKTSQFESESCYVFLYPFGSYCFCSSRL